MEVHAVHPEYLAHKYSSLQETAKADIKRLKICDGKQPFLRKKSENYFSACYTHVGEKKKYKAHNRKYV